MTLGFVCNRFCEGERAISDREQHASDIAVKISSTKVAVEGIGKCSEGG
jgi:hypothetical protein